MIQIDKIKLEEITLEKLEILKDAIEKYISILSELTDRENKSQQHIHLNIAHLWHYEVTKKLMRRNPPQHSIIKLEVATGFVVLDSLQNYQNYTTHTLEQTRLNSIIMHLFSLLPYTSDNQNLSLNSQLNINA